MTTVVNRVADALRSAAGGLIALLLLAQIVIVALRYVFALGWPWATDLLVYLFYLSILLPGLAVLLGNHSVRVDVFYATCPRPWRQRIDRGALLLLLAPAMAYAAWTSVGPMLNSWRVIESSPTFGGLPGYFLLKTALTLFFAGLAFAAVWMALRSAPYGTGERS